MDGYQDNKQLDRSFPFQIEVVPLSASYNDAEPFHWHNYYEITLVLEGSACYYVNGQSFEVQPGDILIFNNAELHGWQVFQPEMRVLVLIFSASLVAANGSFTDMEYLLPFIQRGSNFRNKIDRTDLYAPEIAAIMQQILEEWTRRSAGYRLMIKADVLRILTMLVRHYHDDTRAAEEPANRNKALMRLQAAFEYIDAGYCGKVTLKEAADQVYMSPNYFSHYFHDATGVSFSDYVTMRRVRKAQRLLETTGRSIYEIAIECGFPNNSNFYRLYKKHTGESPRSRR